MPEITVVITTFNLEKMIARCLDELLSQSFHDFNILIVDDCSTDSTADIIKRYMLLHPERVQAVFLPENLGSPGKSRNVGLNSGKINGNYVIFLDGDDSIEQDFLETLYNLSQKTGADISICAYDRIEAETGNVLCAEMRGFPETVNLPPDNDIPAFINGSLWNKLIKTSVIKDILIPDFRVGEDLCFFQKLCQKCAFIAFTEKILIHYQVHGNSVISNTQPEDIYAFAAELKKLHNDSCDTTTKDMLKLLAFIHIGVSMTIRAKDNPNILIKRHLVWTRNFFVNNFQFFGESRFLRLRSLASHGMKGYALWGCMILYRIRLFGLFLFLYGLFRKISHKDVKF